MTTDESAALISGSSKPEPARTGSERAQLAYAYVVFMMLGMAMLLPFNCIISVPDYWELEYPGEHYEYKASTSFAILNPIAVVIMIVLLRLLPLPIWIASSTVYILLMFLALPFLPIVISEYIAEYFSLFLIVTIGLAYSALGSAVMAIVNKAGMSYVQAAMNGQGTAGIVAISLRITTKIIEDLGVFPQKLGPVISAVFFFAASGGLLVLTVPLYLALYLMPACRDLVKADKKAEEDLEADVHESADEALLGDGVSDTDSAPEAPAMSFLESIVAIIKGQFPHNFNFNVFVVFLTTFAAYPGLTTALPSQFDALNRTGWYPVILMAIFMVGDQVGRAIPRFSIFQFSTPVVTGMNLARVLLVPVFLFLYVFRLHFAFDIIPVILIIVFAVSNGLCSTLAFMYASRNLPAHLLDLSGVVIQVVLVSTIFIGNWVGLGLSYIPAVPANAHIL